MEKLSDEQRAMVQQAWLRAKARMALQQIQQEGSERRQRIERARMSGRTIDETGKDISERRPELELVQAGWYWTGHFCVWVIGLTQKRQYVYYQTAAGCKWLPVKKASHWVTVHQQVEESGQGFSWSPPVPNH